MIGKSYDWSASAEVKSEDDFDFGSYINSKKSKGTSHKIEWRDKVWGTSTWKWGLRSDEIGSKEINSAVSAKASINIPNIAQSVQSANSSMSTPSGSVSVNGTLVSWNNLNAQLSNGVASWGAGSLQIGNSTVSWLAGSASVPDQQMVGLQSVSESQVIPSSWSISSKTIYLEKELVPFDRVDMAVGIAASEKNLAVAYKNSDGTIRKDSAKGILPLLRLGAGYTWRNGVRAGVLVEHIKTNKAQFTETTTSLSIPWRLNYSSKVHVIFAQTHTGLDWKKNQSINLTSQEAQGHLKIRASSWFAGVKYIF